METTCYESTNQKTHGLYATKARHTGELSIIQTTEFSVETPTPLEGKSLNHNVTVFMYHYSGRPIALLIMYPVLQQYFGMKLSYFILNMLINVNMVLLRCFVVSCGALGY